MAGPEIPHNEAGVPIIPGQNYELHGNKIVPGGDTAMNTETLEVALCQELNDKLKRIAELEEALREIIEDFGHEDSKKGDWSQQVVILRARKVLEG